jgi:hypothetical protein
VTLQRSSNPLSRSARVARSAKPSRRAGPLALDDRGHDLDLVQPGGVDGEVDRASVGPGGLNPVDRAPGCGMPNPMMNCISHRFQSEGISPVSTTYLATSRSLMVRFCDARRSTWNA